PLVEDQAGGAATAHADVIARVGLEGVGGQLVGAEHANLAGAEGGDVERAPVAADGHAHGKGQAARVLVVGDRRAAGAIVDVLVQVPRQDVPAAQHRDAALVQVAAHGGAGEASRPRE